MVLNNYFREREDLFLLQVDTAKSSAQVAVNRPKNQPHASATWTSSVPRGYSITTWPECSRSHRYINPALETPPPSPNRKDRSISRPIPSHQSRRSTMPGLTIGDTVPDLEVATTHGRLRIHDFVGDTWAIIFCHPGDFTPVCTTELAELARYSPEFERLGVNLLGLSCDNVESHKEWIKDIEAYIPGCKVTYPIVTDPKREVMRELNMVDPDLKDVAGGALPSRALHIVGPDKKVKLSFLYPATTGRNMEEVVRVLESLQMAAKHGVATPVNWKLGEKVLIPPGVSNEEATKMFSQGYETVDLPSKKAYLRFVNV